MTQTGAAVSRRCAVLAICGLVTVAGLQRVGAQARGAGAPSGRLQVAGDVKTPLALTPGEIAAMPHVHVEVRAEDGRTVTYDGVPVSDVLARAGVPLGADLRGPALASYVVATGSDGYRAVFSLAELDPAMTESQVIVADGVEGRPLAAPQGPLRLVAPKDLRPIRGVRMLERLDVVQLQQ